MKYEYKKGDKVKRINSDTFYLKIGDIVIVTKDCSTNNDEEYLNIKIENVNFQDNYFIQNFEKIEETTYEFVELIKSWNELVECQEKLIQTKNKYNKLWEKYYGRDK